jgi:lipoprotein-anchoring transpeptidase ErfK/SrfK
VRFRLGFLGAWGLFAIGVLLAGVVAAAEWTNWKDREWLRRMDTIDRMLAERLGPRLDVLRLTADVRAARLQRLRSVIQQADMKLDDSQDTDQIIVISTAENRLYVRRGRRTIFQAVCSTGKGTTLTDAEGRSMVFDTPTGRFKVASKEQNPQWVPPDWHFIEEARQKGKRVVKLKPGEKIDAATGEPAGDFSGFGGVWRRVRGSSSRGRLLTVKNNTVVEIAPDGTARELPPGKVIYAGGAIVVPPMGTPQRRFGKVLGKYRLNLGGGYGIHGTLMTDQLGRSVTHGCVRLGDDDMKKLYGMAHVRDQVLIY